MYSLTIIYTTHNIEYGRGTKENIQQKVQFKDFEGEEEEEEEYQEGQQTRSHTIHSSFQDSEQEEALVVVQQLAVVLPWLSRLEQQ